MTLILFNFLDFGDLDVSLSFCASLLTYSTSICTTGSLLSLSFYDLEFVSSLCRSSLLYYLNLILLCSLSLQKSCLIIRAYSGVNSFPSLFWELYWYIFFISWSHTSIAISTLHILDSSMAFLKRVRILLLFRFILFNLSGTNP